MTHDENVPAAEVSAELTAAPEDGSTGRRKFPWFRLGVVLLLGLFYAYDLFEAISNTFGVVDQIGAFNSGLGLTGDAAVTVPWGILIANMALPVVVFGLGLFFTRNRNVGVLAFVLLAGLGVNAAVMLSLVALV